MEDITKSQKQMKSFKKADLKENLQFKGNILEGEVKNLEKKYENL